MNKLILFLALFAWVFTNNLDAQVVEQTSEKMSPTSLGLLVKVVRISTSRFNYSWMGVVPYLAAEPVCRAATMMNPRSASYLH